MTQKELKITCKCGSVFKIKPTTKSFTCEGCQTLTIPKLLFHSLKVEKAQKELKDLQDRRKKRTEKIINFILNYIRQNQPILIKKVLELFEKDKKKDIEKLLRILINRGEIQHKKGMIWINIKSLKKCSQNQFKEAKNDRV